MLNKWYKAQSKTKCRPHNWCQRCVFLLIFFIDGKAATTNRTLSKANKWNHYKMVAAMQD